MSIKDTRPLTERFPIGSQWRVIAQGSMWAGRIGTVDTDRHSDIRVPLCMDGIIANGTEIVHFWPDDLVAVSSGRVQDAPTEEVQIKALHEKVDLLAKSLNRQTEELNRTSEERDAEKARGDLMEGYAKASAYPYRVQHGTHNVVSLDFFMFETDATAAYKSRRGYRTLEKREGADLWRLVARDWR